MRVIPKMTQQAACWALMLGALTLTACVPETVETRAELAWGAVQTATPTGYDLLALPDGRFAAIWVSQDSGDASSGSIMGRGADASGLPEQDARVLGPSFAAGGLQVSGDASGGLAGLGYWATAPLDQPRLAGQRFNAAGETVGSLYIVDQILAVTPARQADPFFDLASQPDGRFAVTWSHSNRATADASLCVDPPVALIWRYSALGAPLGQAIPLAGAHPDPGVGSRWPSVATFRGGGYVAAWQQTGLTGDATNPECGCTAVVARRFSPEGIGLDNAPFTVDASADCDLAPQVATDGSAMIWVAYYGDGGLLARRFSLAGQALEAPFFVQPEITQKDGFALAFESDGQAAVAWLDTEAGGLPTIWVRRYDRDGVPLGDAFRVSQLTVPAGPPRIAFAGGGRLAVIWPAPDPDDSSNPDQLFVQKLAPTGRLLGDRAW